MNRTLAVIAAALAVFSASLALSLEYVGRGGSTSTPAGHRMPDGSLMEDGSKMEDGRHMDGGDMGGMHHG